MPITDRVGHFRTDYTDEELATLTPEQHQSLLSIIKAARSVERIEQEVADHDAKVVKLGRALGDAEDRFRASLPPWDRIDEVKRMSENSRRRALGLGPLPPRKDAEGDPKLAAALRKAGAALDAADAEAIKLKTELKEARAALAGVVKVWQTSHATTPEDHYREHLARQQEYYRKIAEGDVETYDQVEHHLCPLDAQMNSGRRGSVNSVNIGYGRKHARRGTQVKLPSQR
jgi:hypothetical protein